MFKHILVLLDGSALAECVLPHATAFAAAFRSRVTLLQVLEPTATSCRLMSIDPVDWTMCRADAEAYLEEVAGRLGNTTAPVERVVLEGKPAQRIVEYIRQSDVDLVALSSHGRSGLNDWNVSSMSLKVISRAMVSTLIIRAYLQGSDQEPVEYRTIMVPLDGSQRAECSLKAVGILSREHEAALLLVHVSPRPQVPPFVPDSAKQSDRVRDLVRNNMEAARKYLELIRSRIPADAEILLREHEDLNGALNGLVDERNPDLVVICAHGASGNRRMYYGSVSSSFIGYCSRPLLIVQDMSPEEMEPMQAELAARQKKGH